MLELKTVVAKTIRMLLFADLIDMNGHVSIRIPNTSHFLINAHSVSRRTVKPSDVVEVDEEGRTVNPNDQIPGETPIHTEIYRRRKDVAAVIHVHPHYATTLTIANQKISPVFGVGAFLGNIPLFEDPDLVNTPEKGSSMAETLGDARIVMLQSHGAVITGATIQDAFVATIFLEENCKKQVEALRISQTIKIFNEEEQERIGTSNWRPKIVNKVWEYYESSARIEGKLQGIEE